MKRFLALLLTVMLALSLCIMVFADTDSYEDEPVQETQAVVEVEETENEEPTPATEATSEDDGIQVCRTECGNCGKMSMLTKKVGGFETGPYEVECIHYPYGTDEVYHYSATYQDTCGSCGFVSEKWSVDEGESLRYCHGWYKTEH